LEKKIRIALKGKRHFAGTYRIHLQAKKLAKSDMKHGAGRLHGITLHKKELFRSIGVIT
jgi:hypothetical protein